MYEENINSIRLSNSTVAAKLQLELFIRAATPNKNNNI